MAEITRMQETVARGFNECQKSKAAHRKTDLILRKHQAKDPVAFEAAFLRCVEAVLPHFKSEPAIERIIQFVIMFATRQHVNEAEEDEEDAAVGAGFDIRLLAHLMKRQNDADKGVRSRVCQLTAGVFGSLSDDAEISDELWDDVQESMCARALDKASKVRAFAIAALQRMQDPMDGEDEVLLLMLKAMNTDSCKDVRKAAIEHISVSPLTIPKILLRLRDVMPDVRRKAIGKFSSVPMAMLKINDRVALLQCGLHDRDAGVRRACETLLREHWLGACCGGDPMKLLRALDVEGTAPRTTEAVVRCMLGHGESANGKKKASAAAAATTITLESVPPPQLISYEAPAHSDREEDDEEAEEEADGSERRGTPNGISAEAALLWRVRCETAPEGSEERDALLPETADLCDALAFAQKCGAAFATKELLLLARLVDVADAASRAKLATVLRALLVSLDTPGEHMPTIVDALATLNQGESDPVCGVVEMLADIVEPADLDAIEAGSAGAPAEGVEQWGRCLNIVHSVLTKRARDSLASATVEGLQMYIVPAVNSRVVAIREEGLRCLALYCLVDADFAAKHVAWITEAAADADEGTRVRVLAVQALCDLLMVYPELPRQEQVVAALAKGLDEGGTNTQLCCAAAESFAKLLVVGRVEEPAVMGRLVHFYFSPPALCGAEDGDEAATDAAAADAAAAGGAQVLSEGDSVARLQQALSVFFLSGACARNNRALVERVALDLVRGTSEDTEGGAVAGIGCADGQLAERLQFLAHFLDQEEEEQEEDAVAAVAAVVEEKEEEEEQVDVEAVGGEGEEEAKDAAGTSIAAAAPVPPAVAAAPADAIFFDKAAWSAHERLALAMCSAVCAAPSGTRAEQISKALNALTMCAVRAPVIKALLTVAVRASSAAKSQAIRKQLSTFSSALLALEAAARGGPVALSAEAVEELEAAMEGAGAPGGAAAAPKGRKKLLSKSKARHSMGSSGEDDSDAGEEDEVVAPRARSSRASKTSAQQKGFVETDDVEESSGARAALAPVN
jgi:condensin complex subunit 3